MFLLTAWPVLVVAQQDAAGLVTGKITGAVACRSDPAQTYALYIPQQGNARPLPVVFFFDPHGNGALPLKKYQTLADAYGFILAGSNNSKNGNDWETTWAIWNRLSGDVRSRLKVNGDRIYACGFSGGAKVAGYVAIRQPGIRGVIAGGAGLPDGVSASDLPFSFTALAGEGDMNLTELVAISRELDKTRTRHRIIVFDGKHEWAPLSVMDQAFAGWQLEAMHDGVLHKDGSFIARRVAADKKRVTEAVRAGQLIRAEQACRVAVSYLDGLTGEADWFRQQAAALAGDPRYRQQEQVREALFAREENTKAEYMQHFQQGDMAYWQQTIAGLEAKAASAAGAEKGMYQRLLAYLSLAFYSISNQLIHANRNEGARHFVELYKLADPTNSEAWYFSAVLDVREGHAAVARADLLKAIADGFRDRERLRAQPEFKGAFSAGEFSGIEGRMPK
jgi:pimeloyl-ACP methyl ester carboxylesterase